MTLPPAASNSGIESRCSWNSVTLPSRTRNIPTYEFAGFLGDVVIAEGEEDRALDPGREFRTVADRQPVDLGLSWPGGGGQVVGGPDLGRRVLEVEPGVVLLRYPVA